MTQQSNYIEYKLWYRKAFVLYEMVKQLYKRETVFIDQVDKSLAIRNIKIHNLNHWNAIKQWTKFDDHLFNVYYSLAKFKDGIPNQTLNVAKRDNKEWNKEFWKHIETFDFLIDFDADDEEHAKELKKDVLKVSQMLEVPHSIRYSGMGYHIIISGEYMPRLSYDPKAQNNYFDLLGELLQALNRDYCGFIDKTVSDSRRVVKLPYSLANYDHISYVCYPYRKHSELLTIQPTEHTASWILNSCEPIKNRGIPIIRENEHIRINATMKKILGRKYEKYKKK